MPGGTEASSVAQPRPGGQPEGAAGAAVGGELWDPALEGVGSAGEPRARDALDERETGGLAGRPRATRACWGHPRTVQCTALRALALLSHLWNRWSRGIHAFQRWEIFLNLMHAVYVKKNDAEQITA